jgi:isopentenyl-diphosphate delta-isomerase
LKKETLQKSDPTAEQRKRDHIELAFKSQVAQSELDQRFYYEPILSGLSNEYAQWEKFSFLGKEMKYPIWVSSMTGGTEWAATINRNLARAVNEFGLGMGLGSCRSLLFDDNYLQDFAVRDIIGNQPLFANLGVAQLDQLIVTNKLAKVKELIKKLEADGLIIHVNPLQEAMQPEGDNYDMAPLEIIKRVLDFVDFPIIVKEVGQGMGPDSLRELMKLPLAALDFGASGGTNFALLELLREDESVLKAFEPLTHVGHSADAMVSFVNELLINEPRMFKCKELIISGGVKNFLDGYYLIEKSKLPAIYGQASGFLRHARGNYEDLQTYVNQQIKGLGLAKLFLKVKESRNIY